MIGYIVEDKKKTVDYYLHEYGHDSIIIWLDKKDADSELENANNKQDFLVKKIKFEILHV